MRNLKSKCGDTGPPLWSRWRALDWEGLALREGIKLKPSSWRTVYIITPGLCSCRYYRSIHYVSLLMHALLSAGPIKVSKAFSLSSFCRRLWPDEARAAWTMWVGGLNKTWILHTRRTPHWETNADQANLRGSRRISPSLWCCVRLHCQQLHCVALNSTLLKRRQG